MAKPYSKGSLGVFICRLQGAIPWHDCLRGPAFQTAAQGAIAALHACGGKFRASGNPAVGKRVEQFFQPADSIIPAHPVTSVRRLAYQAQKPGPAGIPQPLKDHPVHHRQFKRIAESLTPESIVGDVAPH